MITASLHHIHNHYHCHTQVAFSLTADNDCAHLNASNVQHVYGIWLQRARGANLPALQGYLPQSMVNLTELRSVGFTNQRIEVVDVLWDISTLEGVTISSNGVVVRCGLMERDGNRRVV